VDRADATARCIIPWAAITLNDTEGRENARGAVLWHEDSCRHEG
jgi:hypothetical protein